MAAYALRIKLLPARFFSFRGVVDADDETSACIVSIDTGHKFVARAVMADISW
jgi:hypothetical protein